MEGFSWVNFESLDDAKTRSHRWKKICAASLAFEDNNLSLPPFQSN